MLHLRVALISTLKSLHTAQILNVYLSYKFALLICAAVCLEKKKKMLKSSEFGERERDVGWRDVGNKSTKRCRELRMTGLHEREVNLKSSKNRFFFFFTVLVIFKFFVKMCFPHCWMSAVRILNNLILTGTDSNQLHLFGCNAEIVNNPVIMMWSLLLQIQHGLKS